LLCLFDKDAVPELADPMGMLKVKSSSARCWRNAAFSLTLKKTLKCAFRTAFLFYRIVWPRGK
jgi:hypothetical protein